MGPTWMCCVVSQKKKIACLILPERLRKQKVKISDSLMAYVVNWSAVPPQYHCYHRWMDDTDYEGWSVRTTIIRLAPSRSFMYHLSLIFHDLSVYFQRNSSFINCCRELLFLLTPIQRNAHYPCSCFGLNTCLISKPKGIYKSTVHILLRR